MASRPSTTSLVLALVAAAAAPACRSKATERVGRIVVQAKAGVPGLDEAALVGLCRAALTTKLPSVLPDFDWARPVAEGPRWELEAGVLVSESTRPMATDAGTLPQDEVFRGLRVELRLRRTGAPSGAARRHEYAAEALVTRNVRVFDGFEGLMAEGVEAALRQLAIARELESAPSARVRELLGAAEPASRARAVEAVRERELWEFVPELLAILEREDEDPEVVMKAIGALVASRDPRAVSVLIDSARRRSPIYLTQIIFGVAEIGGKEAEAYLFTVASGHADPAVRKNAEDALEELSRRKLREAPRETSP